MSTTTLGTLDTFNFELLSFSSKNRAASTTSTLNFELSTSNLSSLTPDTRNLFFT